MTLPEHNPFQLQDQLFLIPSTTTTFCTISTVKNNNNKKEGNYNSYSRRDMEERLRFCFNAITRHKNAEAMSESVHLCLANATASPRLDPYYFEEIHSCGPERIKISETSESSSEVCADCKRSTCWFEAFLAFLNPLCSNSSVILPLCSSFSLVLIRVRLVRPTALSTS